MFAVETLHSQYYEERAAAEAAKKLAEQQRAAAFEAQLKAPTAAQQATPSSLQHALYQPPPLSRAGSSTLLGNIFQNFIKRAPGTPGITPATTPARAQTPVSPEEMQKQAAEALLAELKRDTDICALPGWH